MSKPNTFPKNKHYLNLIFTKLMVINNNVIIYVTLISTNYNSVSINVYETIFEIYTLLSLNKKQRVKLNVYS